MRTAPDPIELSPETRFMAAVQRPVVEQPAVVPYKIIQLIHHVAIFPKVYPSHACTATGPKKFSDPLFRRSRHNRSLRTDTGRESGGNRRAARSIRLLSGRPGRPLHRRNRPAARSTRIRPGFCLRQATGRIRTAPTETTPASVAGANGRSLPGRKFSPARPRSGAPSGDLKGIRAEFSKCIRIFGLPSSPRSQGNGIADANNGRSVSISQDAPHFHFGKNARGTENAAIRK